MAICAVSLDIVLWVEVERHINFLSKFPLQKEIVIDRKIGEINLQWLHGKMIVTD